MKNKIPLAMISWFVVWFVIVYSLDQKAGFIMTLANQILWDVLLIIFGFILGALILQKYFEK